MPPSRRSRFFIFNTFFYSMLTQKAPTADADGSGGMGRAGHARVERWIKVGVGDENSPVFKVLGQLGGIDGRTCASAMCPIGWAT